ncbi:DUF3006 domain-containing protein [Natrinema gelatinilyticum]|uniref:DUF3006 domain-containing protein n=1 Tax=Natrinema gelatinilyticum TaxID=2961571 RepID=UPI0020C2D35A|nr:DUF3006 domain-containing protein [Natrinema gelatinilyticum]
MTCDGTYTAVVDRFEDDLAVLLLEDDGETTGELVVNEDRLPESGRHVGAVVDVELEDGKPVRITYENQETNDRATAARRRFDELSQRPPATDDESDSR